MAQHDILRVSSALRADMRLENLYNIICNYNDTQAAVWLEDGKELNLTFRDYARMTRNYAAFIRKASGAQPGSYIAISMDTCKEWFPVFWGVIQSGCNAVLLDISLSDDMIAHLMHESGARALISTKPRAMKDGVKFIDASALFKCPEAPADFSPIFGDQVALCTSGTTGTSRIFVYHGRAIAEQVLSSELIYRAQPRILANEHRRAMAFLPYHHVFGFMANLMWISFMGYANIYLENRTPPAILEAAQKCRPELLIAVPLLANNFCIGLQKNLAKQSAFKRGMFHILKGISLGTQFVAPRLGLSLAEKVLFAGIDAKLLGTNLKVIILGGSHTPSEHLRTLNALGYYTVCGFGMTETAVTSVETTLNLKKRISGSVGKPLTNVQYKVTSNSAKQRRGEMLIRGESIHTGRLVGGRLLPPDTLEGGWYPTGDVVRLEKGDRMFVEGRCKDVIINESGENVYPDELEDVFSAVEGAEQFTVLGVKKAGKNQQYEDIALVMNVGEHYQDDTYLENMIRQIAQLNAKLPMLKRLSRVLVTSEKLPLVNGIKVKRLALKAMIQENGLPCRELRLDAVKVEPVQAAAKEIQSPSAQFQEITQKARALYAETLAIQPGSFSDDAHFIDDLGGDSLQVLSIALKAEEQFGITIAPEEYGRLTTVNDMSVLIYGKQSGTDEQPLSPVKAVTPITRFEDAPEFIHFAQRMRALMDQGQENPYFVCHESALKDKSLMAGQEVLNFGSYNYVGMSGRPEVMAAAKTAIDKYGTSASGSRLLAGEKKLHQELEKELADWKQAEACLVLVGGHSTNVSIVGNFCGKDDLIVYDALAHNSIEQGCKLSSATCKPFPHNDPAALESILRTQRDRYAKVLIIIEGVYSMDGDIADVPAFVALKKEYGCFLMVDEAHSACVIGKTGGGVDEYFSLEPSDIDIKMGTLSKGLGTCGGYLAGPRVIIEYLRYNLPGFVFSVGISPPLAAATLESVRQLRGNPQIMADMHRNIDCFVAEAKKRRLDICLAAHTAIIPVLVGKDEDAFLLSNKMRERGVFVPPAVYPAVPKNKARLRFCVISDHEPEQIVEALDKLVALAEELGIQLPAPALS